jgi:hypothetical protein
MSGFSEHTVRTLTAMARELYPYDFLDDTYYAIIIERIAAQGDADRIELLEEGASALDAWSGMPFVSLPDDRKFAALKALEATPFFKDMRNTTVRELFNNPAVWPFFGYEGPSGHKGGYIKRGVSDANWIPEE